MSSDIEKVMNGEPIKVYAMQSLEHGWVHIYDFDDLDSYIKIAEGEVVFRPVEKDEAIQKAAEMLDQKIQETYTEAERKVSAIKDQKARLLALTHDAKSE